MLNLYLLCLILLASCSKVSEGETINGLRTNLIIESEIFKVSYNEVYEQPNWIEYRVRSIEKKYDRDGMDFYEVDSVHTSDDDDYYNNKISCFLTPKSACYYFFYNFKILYKDIRLFT